MTCTEVGGVGRGVVLSINSLLKGMYSKNTLGLTIKNTRYWELVRTGNFAKRTLNM